MTNQITIVRKESKHRNKLSGHSWMEQGRIKGYDVHGGVWMREFFVSLPAAETEKERRDNIDREFLNRKESEYDYEQ